ncbi:MAG: ImmA/IrrE family metallo-endopeptidase [Nanoarchaeota archaeon]|nr:ImmA/IrrE family metallo-endopeptidase [Nanoarchaeota archaeon]
MSVQEPINAGWLAALNSSGPRPYLYLCVDSPERKNYAIAHELGHLLLHPFGVYRDLTFHEDEKDEEAHKFAIQLLLPERMLRTAAQVYRNDTVKLSELFRVPDHLLRIRLAGILGL